MKELSKKYRCEKDSLRKRLADNKVERRMISSMNTESQISQRSSNFSSTLKTPIEVIKKEYLLKNSTRYHRKYQENPNNKEDSSSFLKNSSNNNSYMMSISSKTMIDNNPVSKMTVADRYIMMQMKQKLETIENKLNLLMNDNKNNDSEKSCSKVLDTEETKLLERARSQIYKQFSQTSGYRKSIDSYLDVGFVTISCIFNKLQNTLFTLILMLRY